LFIEKQSLLPATILLVSGGHTQIIEANSLNNMKIIATTMDDSFGESFDKVSKMLGLGYPGGPVVQENALKGDENAYNFPIPLRQSPNIEYSFSGLKNAVRVAIIKEKEEQNSELLDVKTVQNICASFQKTAADHIIMKLKKYFKSSNPSTVAIVGGASANIHLRQKVQKLCNEFNSDLILSNLEFCSDNAAMIGRVAVEQYYKKEFISFEDIDVKGRLKEF
jgi:N6-L-threonylcarbamoyladenine synthase